MVLFLLYLTPLVLLGAIIVYRICSLTRLELLIPVGSVLGISLFVFFINITAFFLPVKTGINITYISVIFLLILILKKTKKIPEISLPKKKIFFFWLASVLIWAGLIFWKGNYALIGSDTNLYYSIAHSFIKGNFPPLTPWQPEVPLAYHLGSFELLGAFFYLTNLSFEYLHIFFASLFTFFCSQIVIWIWKRHNNFFSIFWANLTAAVVLISFGFFKLAVPVNLKLPQISNLHQFFLWIRNLPTVNQTIEVYGAPINLDTMIYFIFHSFGLSLILSLIVIMTCYKGRLALIILAILLASLALINETAFVVYAPVAFLYILFKEWRIGNLIKNFRFLLLIFFISIFLIMVQGGTLTNLLLPSKVNLEKSVYIFPDQKDIKENFREYHFYQQISKFIPQKNEWYPLSWFHFGTDLLILISIILLFNTKFSTSQKIIVKSLFVAGIFSLLAYNYIVPKYLIANGNRFLASSFLFFSLAILYSLQNLLENLKIKILLKYFIWGSLILFILVPTILPPLALLTKTRFGEGKLKINQIESTEGITWIKNNLPFSSRVIILDSRSPHPSGNARALVQAGVFAPIFMSDFRAYTIEASPDYLDIVYYLSPKALKRLNIDTILIDSIFYETLPDSKKEQLVNEQYFTLIFFKENTDRNWEKIFKVNKKYLEDKDELTGTIEALTKFPLDGDIFIANEESFNPSYLRRAIIFSLRQRNIFYLPQSGVYLNVEANINSHAPKKDNNYDYLILGENTIPKNVCSCEAKLLWIGFRGRVFLWKVSR